MVLMRRQNSTPGKDYVVDYSCYDSMMVNGFQTCMPERSGYDDPEQRSPGAKMPQRSEAPVKLSPLKSTNTKKWLMIFQYVAFTAMLINLWSTNTHLSKTMDDLSVVNSDYDALHAALSETERELQRAHDDFTRLQMKLNHVQPMATLGSGVKNGEERKAVADTIMGRHDAQADRMSVLQRGIQAMHRAELEEKYGPGPYEIEVAVLLGGKRKFFTIETAPNDLMPHAVHAFVNMVENKIWDDTMFIHKVDHVVLAAPINSSGTSKKPKLTKKLLFPEYSDEFPHSKYTIGFQGRPGGPEIYINLDDNRDYHGPGGQLQHDLVEEADPCFGTITHGRDVLEEFQQLNARAQEEDDVYYSKIESMRLV